MAPLLKRVLGLERSPREEVGEAKVGEQEDAAKALARLLLAAEGAQHEALGVGDGARESAPTLEGGLGIRQRLLEAAPPLVLVGATETLRDEEGIDGREGGRVVRLLRLLPVRSRGGLVSAERHDQAEPVLEARLLDEVGEPVPREGQTCDRAREATHDGEGVLTPALAGEGFGVAQAHFQVHLADIGPAFLAREETAGEKRLRLRGPAGFGQGPGPPENQ